MNRADGPEYPGDAHLATNKLGIHDPRRFDEALNDFASIEWAQLRREPVAEPPNFEYLRHIHHRLFQDTLPFAGDIRTEDAQAVGVGIPYCRPDYIRESLGSLFSKLGQEDYLRGLDVWEFSVLLAERWGELSAIHPFKDGNSRSQSAYVSRLAERAGHPINWQRIDVDELRVLRLHAVVGRDGPLANYLSARLVRPEG